MIKFWYESVPDDCDERFKGHLMVTWCEVHGMYGLSAPTYEELRAKVEDEVKKVAPYYQSRPLADLCVKFR